ncbi:hypothetical protein PR002_g23480 [Phytophthora rubi]|uniref:Uncharacterized protein n=1 Tax=Phytophthora rubi TaxID=129364 RepID=A0A6A3IKP6_9STRA|nr:hypothetical protein PR002_g23480 [Phytophthora rubi]
MAARLSSRCAESSRICRSTSSTWYLLVSLPVTRSADCLLRSPISSIPLASLLSCRRGPP